jgi:hypothetical protein
VKLEHTVAVPAWALLVLGLLLYLARPSPDSAREPWWFNRGVNVGVADEE